MKLNQNIVNNYPILTDGGLETDIIFNHGISLPHFASFPMIENPHHREILKSYYRDYLEVAKKNKTGFILESPTWRANPEWGYKLGYNLEDLKNVYKQSISILRDLKDEYESIDTPVFISGQIGPKGDGYIATDMMNFEEAKTYHSNQIKTFKNEGVDTITAQTLTYLNEALGIVLQAQECQIPVIISFTVELNGKLPSGDSLNDVITEIDSITNNYPMYYMINCAHPSHFIHQLETDDNWRLRIKGVRSNASCKSHAELNDSVELDAGNKEELSDWHLKLKSLLPNLTVYGGCCGTDVSHVESICNKILN